MSDGDSRLKELLDGKLSPQEIADDPVLVSLAERIYGTDFLKQVGITRGESKRALVEQFTELEGDDLLIDVLPVDDAPLPMPDDMPPNPSYDVETEDESQSNLMAKLNIFSGFVGIVAILTNLFYGFGNFLSGCSTEAMHIGCDVTPRMKLNWMDFFRIDDQIAWSEVGSFGIPDIVLGLFCLLLIIRGLRSRN
ncbi:MAG: hypothetical protein VX473_02015 [Candidatus Thermoplasmatota archaeon]|nr:hypothetical protein [Candidatus Thermoplasmatota archaeon]